MAATIYSKGGIELTRLTGPDTESPRTRVQLNTPHEYLTLTYRQWQELCRAIQLIGPDPRRATEIKD
jgi:hypothetical protein